MNIWERKRRTRSHLDVIEISFAHVLVAEGKVGAPSVVLVDGGGAEHPAARRSPRRRARRARIDDRTTVPGTADTAAAAAAAPGCAAAVVFPRRAGRRRAQRSNTQDTKWRVVSRRAIDNAPLVRRCRRRPLEMKIINGFSTYFGP